MALKREGDHTDHKDRWKDRVAGKGERDPDCKGVNTGCSGKCQKPQGIEQDGGGEFGRFRTDS